MFGQRGLCKFGEAFINSKGKMLITDFSRKEIELD